MQRLFASLRRYWAIWSLGALFLAGQLYYGWIALTQQWSHHTLPHDVGLVESALYWTLHGRFMYSPMIGRSLFGVHFTPTLLLVLPVYALAPSPTTLLLFYSVFLVGACVPVFFLTRRLTGSDSCGVLLAALYLVNFFVGSIHLAAHYEALLPFFLLGAMYCAVTKRVGCYWVLMVLSLGVKTDIGLYTLCWGAYLALAQQQRRLGLATMVVSGAWVAVALLVAHLMRGAVGVPAYLRYWREYGESYGQIVWYLATHPWLVVAALASIRLVQLIATIGFLPLADWRSLVLAVPPAAVMLVSHAPDMHNLEHYRSATILPFLFFSASLGLQRVRSLVGTRRKHATVVLGVIVLVNAYIWATAPTLTLGLPMRPFPVTRHDRTAARLIAATIPKDASVAAQWDLYCQVPQRPGLTTLADYRNAEFILLDTTGWAYLEEDVVPAALAHIQSQMNVVVAADGYVIAKRR